MSKCIDPDNDESPCNPQPICPEIFFDKYSESISDNLFDLERVAGTSIVFKSQFIKAINEANVQAVRLALSEAVEAVNKGVYSYDDYYVNPNSILSLEKEIIGKLK